jgi:hypothetical protein
MEKLFFSPDSLDLWTAVAAIATFFSMVALIITLIFTRKTVLLTSLAMQDSLKSFRKTMEASHYTELDHMYCDLLKVALGKPYLTIPSTLTAAQSTEYDIYAYMMWNFLETIHDRCIGVEELKATWYPVIDAENRLHRKWFDEERNKHKFKESFKKFVEHNKFKHWIVPDAQPKLE